MNKAMINDHRFSQTKHKQLLLSPGHQKMEEKRKQEAERRKQDPHAEKGNREAEKRKREDEEKMRLAQIDLEKDMKRDNGLLSYDPRAVMKTLAFVILIIEHWIFLALGRVGSGRGCILCKDVGPAEAD